MIVQEFASRELERMSCKGRWRFYRTTQRSRMQARPCADSVIGHSSESSVAHFIACAGKSKLVHMVFSTNGSAEHLR